MYMWGEKQSVNTACNFTLCNMSPLPSHSTCGLGEVPWPPLGHDGPQGPERHQLVLYSYAYCGWWSKPMWVTSPAQTRPLSNKELLCTVIFVGCEFERLCCGNVLIFCFFVFFYQGLCHHVMPSWMCSSLMVWSLRSFVHVLPLLRPWLWPYAGITSVTSHAPGRGTLIIFESKTSVVLPANSKSYFAYNDHHDNKSLQCVKIGYGIFFFVFIVYNHYVTDYPQV